MGEALHDLCDAADDHQDAEDDHAGQCGRDGIQGGQNAENDQEGTEADEPARLEALWAGEADGVETVGHGLLRSGTWSVGEDAMFCDVGGRDKTGVRMVGLAYLASRR